MEGGDNEDNMSKVFGFIKNTGKKGLEMGQSLSQKAIEVVRDPNLTTNEGKNRWCDGKNQGGFIKRLL